MPERTDEVILQSDLTAIAPGPLTPDTAADLALLADRESTGIAGVRRFTRTSLRRALDAGWTGDRVRQWWTDHSLSDVPQSLLVLLDDVVRDHGRVSVAAAGALLEVDDPSRPFCAVPWRLIWDCVELDRRCWWPRQNLIRCWQACASWECPP